MALRNAMIRLTPMPPRLVRAAPMGSLHKWIPAPTMNDAEAGVLHICGLCTERTRVPVGMEPDAGICPGGG